MNPVPRHLPRVTTFCAVPLLLLAGFAAAAEDPAWRITHARTAPWAAADTAAPAADAAKEDKKPRVKDVLKRIFGR